MKEFPLVLEASNREETNNWFFGDALLAECGPPSRGGINDGSYELLKEAAKFLFAKKGRVYTADYLSGLRITAHAFGKDVRFFEVPWTVYHVAGSPEYLKAIIDGAPKGTRVTYDYVEGIKRTQREHARAEREEENRKATAAREKAEAEEAAALKKVLDAQKATEKEAAKAEAAKASRKTEKARQKEHETKVAPKKKPGPPAKEEVPQLVAEMSFIANASRSVVLARQSLKDLESCLDQLGPKSIKALRSNALEAANAWNDAAASIQNQFGGSSTGHLSVVGE